MSDRTPQSLTIALLGDFLHVGGVETHLLSLLRHSDPTLYRWLVIGSASPDFAGRATALGADVLMWRPQHVFDVAALFSLVRLIRSHGVDLVHPHSPRTAVFGRLAGRLLGLPVVVTVHLPPHYYVRGQNLFSRGKRWLYPKVERLLNHGCTDYIIYVSSRVCQEALSQGVTPCSRTAVIPNGIDLTPYGADGNKQAVRAGLSTPASATVVCCVGRLDPQKGVDILLEAIHLLSMESGPWQVWLVGDGPERVSLEIQSRRFELERGVQFLGYRDDVAELLKASDVFVLPARYEAMPIAIVEAMAAGLPCVVTDVGENSEMIKDGVSGRVISPENPHALAAALSELISDRPLRESMGAAARERSQDYDVKRMVDRTLEVYEQVFQGH